MFFDTHAHLADEAIQTNLEEILKLASNARVERILCVGTTASSSRTGIDIANGVRPGPQVYASVGVHPNYAHQSSDDDWKKIRSMAQEARVVALGETGLDKHWDDCDWDTQVENLDRHWDLSFETGLPVILHSRDCELEMLDELEKASARFGKPLNGIMHSFVGAASTAERCLKLGLHVSFAGMVTYKKAGDLRAVAAIIPEDRLLIETDSPYLTPEPHRGRRPNTPANVIHTAECIAKARGCSLSEIAKLTTENACRLLSISLMT